MDDTNGLTRKKISDRINNNSAKQGESIRKRNFIISLQRMADHEPGVYCFLYQDKVVLNPQCLEEDELDTVAEVILDIIK